MKKRFLATLLVAAMTIIFMNAWNNYLWPTVIIFFCLQKSFAEGITGAVK